MTSLSKVPKRKRSRYGCQLHVGHNARPCHQRGPSVLPEREDEAEEEDEVGRPESGGQPPCAASAATSAGEEHAGKARGRVNRRRPPLNRDGSAREGPKALVGPAPKTKRGQGETNALSQNGYGYVCVTIVLLLGSRIARSLAMLP